MGPATHMLSYTCSYNCLDVVDALQEHCRLHRCGPRRTYVRMDVLCVNQHSIAEAKESGGPQG